jgi:hypothetical protein
MSYKVCHRRHNLARTEVGYAIERKVVEAVAKDSRDIQDVLGTMFQSEDGTIQDSAVELRCLASATKVCGH